MLKINKVQTIEGIVVYGDDSYDDVFYPIPESPRFRRDSDGSVIFRFLKYRNGIDRADGKRGGGFAFFDTELTLPQEKLEAVVEQLQAQVQAMHRSADFRPSQPGPPMARIGTVSFTRGTVDLLLREDNGELVEAVESTPSPSLFGRNIASFMVEFSERGSTLFQQALQGKGGVVQVAYNLGMMVKLPEMSGRAWFNAEKFYSYEQTINVDWAMYGEDDYVESLTEQFEDTEAMGVELRLDAVLPDPEADRKMKDKIRSSLDRALQDAILRKMIPDIESVPLDDRGLPDDIENMERHFTTTKVASFEMTYRENTAVEWTIHPQGTLPNITNLVDADGKALVWDDYEDEIDLDDPFFKQLHVQVGVNADFENLPIHSIEVKLEYRHGGQLRQAEYSFKDANTTEVFKTFIENDRRDYTYSYQVNYKGSSRVFQSDVMTSEDEVLTVNVDDLGVLNLAVEVGDIDFQHVSSAQLTMRYQDTGVAMFEQQFALNQQSTTHEITHVLHQPRRRPVDYRVDFFMTDGRHIADGWRSTDSHLVLINDPLGQTRRFEVRAAGDFTNRIDQIFLDMEYNDSANAYVLRRSYALSKGNESVSDRYPVLGSGDGVVTYSGQIRYQNGTIRPIPLTEADGTVIVGDVASSKLAITVIPTLLDWAQVRLARVALRHGEGSQARSADLIFSAQATTAQSWEVLLQEGQTTQYRWQATYYMADGSQSSTEWVATGEPSIVLTAPLLSSGGVGSSGGFQTPVSTGVGAGNSGGFGAGRPTGSTPPPTPVTTSPSTTPPGGTTTNGGGFGPGPSTGPDPVTGPSPVPAGPGGTPPPPPRPGGTPPPPPRPGGTPPPPPMPGSPR